MIFSSLLFLFRFLPAVLVLYYLAPRPLRNLVLLLCSLVFYAWGEPVYIILMIVSILVSYTGGILVDRFKTQGKRRAARAALLGSSVVSLSLLGFFKYADFVIGTVNSLTGAGIGLLKIALPIGISFYTFQTMSYTIDVYRGEAKVQKNLISFGAYVTMFPQLIAGPIVQYKTIDRQLRTRKETAGQFAYGIHRFMIGLGKKVLLANNAGVLWDTISSMEHTDWPHIHFSCILTFLHIRIWRSDWDICLDSVFWKILIILIYQKALRNFGEDGTFRLVPGFGIMCIFHLEEIESGCGNTSAIFLWSGC